MSIMKHARKELNLLEKTKGGWVDDEMYNGMLSRAVLELLQTFCNQGHSGGSAWSTLHVFWRLVNHKPLTPLTGKDDEWNDVSEAMGKKCFQNNRWSTIFKDGKSGKAYYFETSGDQKKVFVKFPFEVP